MRDSYAIWETKQGISPSSSGSFYAEKAWKVQQVKIDRLSLLLNECLNEIEESPVESLSLDIRIREALDLK